MKQKRLRNTDLCKQQQKIEAKYYSTTNAGNKDINLEDSPHLMNQVDHRIAVYHILFFATMFAH